MYSARVLLATHSPVVLNAAELAHVLCFAKLETAATDIVSGARHPKLRCAKWLCCRFLLKIPAGEDQYGRMTAQCFG